MSRGGCLRSSPRKGQRERAVQQSWHMHSWLRQTLRRADDMTNAEGYTEWFALRALGLRRLLRRADHISAPLSGSSAEKRDQIRVRSGNSVPGTVCVALHARRRIRTNNLLQPAVHTPANLEYYQCMRAEVRIPAGSKKEKRKKVIDVPFFSSHGLSRGQAGK